MTLAFGQTHYHFMVHKILINIRQISRVYFSVSFRLIAWTKHYKKAFMLLIELYDLIFRFKHINIL